MFRFTEVFSNFTSRIFSQFRKIKQENVRQKRRKVENKVKWNKNIKGQPQKTSDDGDKKIQLNEPSRQFSLTKLMVSRDLPRSVVTSHNEFDQQDLHSTPELECVIVARRGFPNRNSQIPSLLPN